jgi:hypothetical protein
MIFGHISSAYRHWKYARHLRKLEKSRLKSISLLEAHKADLIKQKEKAALIKQEILNGIHF